MRGEAEMVEFAAILKGRVRHNEKGLSVHSEKRLRDIAIELLHWLAELLRASAGAS